MTCPLCPILIHGRPVTLLKVQMAPSLILLRLIHTTLFPCRATIGLDCVFPIWFTQCDRVWFTHAMLRSQGHGTAQHGHGMCELVLAIQRWHVDDLPAFGFFRLPHGAPRRLLSEAYQSVKLYDWQFGYFWLPRWLSRRTRLCHRMAGAWHGMCELAFNMLWFQDKGAQIHMSWVKPELHTQKEYGPRFHPVLHTYTMHCLTAPIGKDVFSGHYVQ
jgi:hypothetical protein